MKTRVVIFSFIAAGFLFASNAFSCPCHPCKCSPCTCGGGGSKSSGGGKHHGDHHGHDHGGGASVGVGVDVDLSSVGHRTREADPFATGGNDKPVAHTEEKRTTKHKEHEPTTNSFDDIKLTGRESKDENAPNTFNVDNDEHPTTVAKDPAGDLKKAYDKYHEAIGEWLKKQPHWSQLLHDWTQSPNTEEGNKKSAKAKKKIDKLFAQFQTGDGKGLVDDWKKAFDNVLKSGGTVDDNSMVPPPADDIEKKKYAVIKAQNDLRFAQKMLDDKKQTEANKDEEVNKAREALNNFKNTNDPGYKGAMDDLNKAIDKAGQKWAGTDEGKAETKKVRDAEKELDKAKDAWKPFEKYAETK